MGAACARRLAQGGAQLVLFDAKAEGMSRVAETLGSTGASVTTYVGDVTRAEHAEASVRLALDNYGRVDMLINAAASCDRPGSLRCPKKNGTGWLASISRVLS